MGASIGPAIATFWSQTAWYVVLAKTILVNVALGSLEFEDGGTWVADE